ncbi:MAG: phosphoribosylanthranilate isomerase [Thermoleophilia bacterium]|nr:phosphoribosylanthranilate isomerase [Thermoleophilia bacterium]
MNAHHDLDVKLCGLRTVDDALAAIDAGAGFGGIVLVPGARRRVDVDVARSMVAVLGDGGVEAVGIVGGDLDERAVVGLVEAIGLSSVQLVGDDRQARRLARALDGVTLFRSLSVPGHDDIAVLATAWEALGARVVFDAPPAGGELGGTGHAVDHDDVRDLLVGTRGLAGGLTPETVGDVVRLLNPSLVDSSSGIEGPDGIKDPARMRAFVTTARTASRTTTNRPT